MPSQTSPIFDSRTAYGAVSRLLHWLMALLFACQFLSAILHVVDRSLPLAQLLWGWHFSVGFLLLVLALLRGVWGLVNLGRRPPHAPSLIGLAARAGHLALYGLMAAVPALALLRAYGRGRGFSAFGVEIFAPGGAPVDWMTALGNSLHGLLGWLLLATVAGHVGMVIIHHFVWRDDTLARMAGRPEKRLGRRTAAAE